MMKHGSRVLISFLALFLVSGLGSTALAAEKANKESEKIGDYRNEGIDVVQQRVFRKRLRHEFYLGGGIIPNNQFLFYEVAQTSYTFHFSEGLAFEGIYGRAFNQNDPIIDNLLNIPCPSATTDLDGDGTPDPIPSGASVPTCPVELNPGPDPMKNYYFGNLVWSPVYGKFALFSKKVVHFDLMFTAGAGMFDNRNSNRFAFNVGVGFKFFINKWLTARFEFKNITVREGAPFNQIVNNQLWTLGLSAFLPTK